MSFLFHGLIFFCPRVPLWSGILHIIYMHVISAVLLNPEPTLILTCSVERIYFSFLHKSIVYEYYMFIFGLVLNEPQACSTSKVTTGNMFPSCTF